MSQKTIFRMQFTLNHCPNNMSPELWQKERAFYTWNSHYSSENYMFAEHKLMKDLNHWGYMTKSTGVFDLIHELSKEELEEKAESIRNTNSHIWHPIISLNEEMSQHMNSPEEASKFLKYALSPLWEHSQLKKENVNVLAGLHKDTDNRHLHISIWEKDNDKLSFKGVIPQRAIDEVIVKSAYYFSEKKYNLHKARDKAIDSLKEFCPSARTWNEQRYNEELRHKIMSLANSLPDDGRLQYNSSHMIPYRKQVDDVVNHLITSDHTLRCAYQDYTDTVSSVCKDINQIMVDSKVKTFKDARSTGMIKNINSELHERMGNYVLNICKELKGTPKYKAIKTRLDSLTKKNTKGVDVNVKTKNTLRGGDFNRIGKTIEARNNAKQARALTENMINKFYKATYQDLSVKTNFIYDYLKLQKEQEWELSQQGNSSRISD